MTRDQIDEIVRLADSVAFARTRWQQSQYNNTDICERLSKEHLDSRTALVSYLESLETSDDAFLLSAFKKVFEADQYGGGIYTDPPFIDVSDISWSAEEAAAIEHFRETTYGND